MRLVALSVALSALLAGCSSGPSPGAQQDEPGVITDPTDLGYLQNATPGSHVHDYWQGRDQVLVLDKQSGGGSVSYGSDHGLMARFQPDDGSIVPQGTGVIEATLDWTLSEPTGPLPSPTGNAFTRMELWVKTAVDAEASFVAVAEKGVPFRFNSTNEQDDPPHYTLSLWEFDVVAWNEGGAETKFSGRFHLAVTAIRTLPLVVFPPHPDRWNGSTELTLTAFDVELQLHTGLVLTYACYGGCADITFSPDDGVVVPYDTSEVEVTVTTAMPSTPVPFAFQVHGANTRTMADVEADSDEVGKQVFIVPVAGTDTTGDSPYASQSLWEFRVHMDTPEDQGAWSGKYNVTAVARK